MFKLSRLFYKSFDDKLSTLKTIVHGVFRLQQFVYFKKFDYYKIK